MDQPIHEPTNMNNCANNNDIETLVMSKQLDETSIKNILISGNINLKTIISHQILTDNIISEIIFGKYNSCTEDEYIDSEYIDKKQKILLSK